MTKNEIHTLGIASAKRLFDYLAGKPVYLGVETMIYPAVQGGPSMSYRPFDEGLMRHDIHVLIYCSEQFARLSAAPQEDTGAAELLDFFEAHKTKMGPAIRAACLDEFAPTIRATIAHCMAELEDADIDEFTGDDICEDDLRADAALLSNPSGEQHDAT